MAQIFPIDFDEKLTMAQDDYILFSDSEDGNKIKKAQYKNLKGEQGDPGTPGADGTSATITVGSTTTGTPGSSASVTNSGTSSAAVLDFTIPQGAKGEPGEDGQDGADGAAATITVGTTTTLPAGSSATVTNVGTSQDAILNFGIPKGDSGTGSGDVNGPASSTDGDVAIFDGSTGKLIKDGSVSLATLSAGASAGATAMQPGDDISDLNNDSGFITSSYHDATKQDLLTAGTNIQISASNVISATAGSDIEYKTQAEYNALLPGAASDGKHYFIYSTSGGGGWQPGANTIAYYPLSANTNDQLNTYNLTNSGITFGTLGGVTCANFDGSTTSAIGNFYSYGTGDLTASVWGYPTSNSQLVWWCIGNSSLVLSSKLGNVDGTSAPTPTNSWTNIVFTITGGKLKIYSNGTLYLDTNFSSSVTGTLYLGQNQNGQAILSGGLSELIFENKARTAQEVADYYNQTKSQYGIS